MVTKNKFTIFLYFVFWVQVAGAQLTPTNSEDSAISTNYLAPATEVVKPELGELTFTADRFANRVAEDFLGAMVVCSPYCEAISQKLDDNAWRPDLATVQVFSNEVLLLDIDDPMYKALFPKKAKIIERASKKRKAVRAQKAKEKARLEALAKEEINKIKPPKTAFDNGYRAGLSARYTSVTQKSNSTVQAEFEPQAGLMGVNLGLGYLRAKPLGFLKKWWQFEVGYELDLYSNEVQLKSEDKLTLKKNKMFVIVWLKEKNYTWGAKYTKLKQDYAVSENSLNAFSYTEDSVFVGPVYKKGRYFAEFGYGIQYNLSEQQPFRDKLLSSTQLFLEGGYCQPRKKIKDVLFTPCYSLMYMQSDNSATFKPNINPTGSVDLKRQDIALTATLYFGEDFLR